MANLYTVGIELQTSQAQQAIAQLERSFQGMSANASAAQQASMALGQGLTQSGKAANGAADEYQRAAEEAARLNAEQEQLDKSTKAAAVAFGVVAYKAQQYIQAAIQVGEATQGAIAANATLTNDSAGLDKTFQQLTKSLNYQTNSLELNKAAYDVLSAGITKTADITQVMEAGVKGAKGGFSDLGTITDATTTIMNAFHKGADQANKIVDQMIQTQNDGKIVAREYGHQIGVVASGAASAGVSLEELNAAVGIATVAGVQVSSTFTGLRQAISAIVSPSEQAKKVAKELGIEFSQNAIKSKGFAGVLKDVAEATKGNADQITKLFGSVEAKAVIDPILNDLPKYNQFLENQTKIAGQAAAANEKVTKGLKEQQGALANVMSEINTKVFYTIEPVLGSATGLAFNLAKAFADLPDPIQKAAIGVGLFTVAIATTSAAILAFNALGLTTATVMGAIGVAFGIATGPIGLTVAAVTAAYLVFKQLYDSSAELRKQIGQLSEVFVKGWSAVGKAVSSLTGTYQTHATQSQSIFKRMGDWFGDYVADMVRGYQLMEHYANQVIINNEKRAKVGGLAISPTEISMLMEGGNQLVGVQALNAIALQEQKLKQTYNILQVEAMRKDPLGQFADNEQITRIKKQLQELADFREQINSQFTVKKLAPVNNIVPTNQMLSSPVKEDEQTQKEREKAEKQYQAERLRYEKELRDQKLQNDKELADKRKTEFEKARDKERRAWEDNRSFEQGMFDLKRNQEQKLFDLKRRHQDLLLQRELQGQSEIVRAVIQSHNERKQVDVNASVAKQQYDADMAGFQRQRQQLTEQKKRQEQENAKAQAFNQKQFVSTPKERAVAPAMPQLPTASQLSLPNQTNQAAIANFGQQTVMSLAAQFGLRENRGQGNYFGSIRTGGRNPDSFHRSGNAVDFGDRMQGVGVRQAHKKFTDFVNKIISDGTTSHIEELIWNGYGSPLGDYFATGGRGPFYKLKNGKKVPIGTELARGHNNHLHIAETNRGGDPYVTRTVAQSSPSSSNDENMVKASFYGGPTDRQWHGRKTASGEVYDENAMTAAVPYRSRTDKSPLHPFGTELLVTAKNGKQVKVRVTDTGNFGTDPRYGGRGLDLSYGAAKALGVTQQGVAQVKYQVINPTDKASYSLMKSPGESVKAPVIDYKKTPYAQVNVPGVNSIDNQIKLLNAQERARKALWEIEQKNNVLERENAEIAKQQFGANLVNQKFSGLKQNTEELQSQLELMGLQGEARDKALAQLETQKQFQKEINDLEKFAATLNPKDPLLASVNLTINQLKEGLAKYQAESFKFIQLQNAVSVSQSGFETVDRNLESVIQQNKELRNQLDLVTLTGEEQSKLQMTLEVQKATQNEILAIEKAIADLRQSNPDNPAIATLETQLGRVRAKAVEIEAILTDNRKLNKAIADMEGFNKYQESLKSASYEVAALSSQSDQAARMAENMGNAFGDAFTRFATGAASAQDAGVSFLTGLSNAFASEVQRMLAIAATSQLLPMLSGMFGGGNQAPNLITTVASGLTGLTGFNTGADFSIDTGSTLPGFTFNGPMLAEGGIVDKPTIAMIGEGSEPEAVIPLSKLNKGNSPTTINAPVNVTVNNDGSAKIETNQAGELGKAIQQAVVNELVRQQRPGGLIARR